MSKFKSVFYQHYSKHTEDHATLQEAIEYLEDRGDRDEISAIAVLWDGKITWTNKFYPMEVVEQECKEFLT